MIRYIKGCVAGVDQDSLLLENQGIGYGISMSARDLDRVPANGTEIKVYTYLHVKEDAMQLFGFFQEDALQVFRLLLGVNGIGPKGALGVLSALSADDLRFAVLSDDVTAIAKAPGIGKKTAQKLILELKDKFSLQEAFDKKLMHTEEGGTSAALPASGRAETDAVEALVALGYSGTEALQAVKKVGATEDMDADAILKAALRFIF